MPPVPDDPAPRDASRAEVFRQNLLMLMHRHALGLDDLIRRARLSRPMLSRWLRQGAERPRNDYLARLTALFELPDPRLLFDPALASRTESWPGRRTDRITNPMIEEVASDHPEVFAGFRDAEWDELYSLHGTGGPLNPEGVLHSARQLAAKRELRRKFDAILETEHFAAIAAIVELMYRDTDADHAVVPDHAPQGPQT